MQATFNSYRYTLILKKLYTSKGIKIFSIFYLRSIVSGLTFLKLKTCVYSTLALSCVIFPSLGFCAGDKRPVDSAKSYRYHSSQKRSYDDKWPMYLELEGKKGNFRDIAKLSWMAPLWQDDSSMLFGDVRLVMDNRQDREVNIGLGYRHIVKDWDIASDGIILGGYAFFDRRKSTFGNKYNQGTFGVEALGDYFRFSANYYLPQNKKNFLGKAFDVSFLNKGWNVVDDELVFTYNTLVNVGANEERTLKGYDVEIRGKIPVTEVFNIWGGVGAYRFSRAGVHRNGPMAMFDVEIIDSLGIEGSRATLGFEYRKDKGETANRYGVLKLTAPLMSVGKGEKYPSLTGIEYEMTRFVLRDVDVQTGVVKSSYNQGSLFSSGQSIADGSEDSRITKIHAKTGLAANVIDTSNPLLSIDKAWAEAFMGVLDCESKGKPCVTLWGATDEDHDVSYTDGIFDVIEAKLLSLDISSGIKDRVLAEVNEKVFNLSKMNLFGATELGLSISTLVSAKTLASALQDALPGISDIDYGSVFSSAAELASEPTHDSLLHEVDAATWVIPTLTSIVCPEILDTKTDLSAEIGADAFGNVVIPIANLGQSSLTSVSVFVPDGIFSVVDRSFIGVRDDAALRSIIKKTRVSTLDGSAAILPLNTRVFANDSSLDGSFDASLLSASTAFETSGIVASGEYLQMNIPSNLASASTEETMISPFPFSVNATFDKFEDLANFVTNQGSKVVGSKVGVKGTPAILLTEDFYESGSVKQGSLSSSKLP